MALNCINLHQKRSEGFGGWSPRRPPGPPAWEYGLEYFYHYIPAHRDSNYKLAWETSDYRIKKSGKGREAQRPGIRIDLDVKVIETFEALCLATLF